MGKLSELINRLLEVKVAHKGEDPEIMILSAEADEPLSSLTGFFDEKKEISEVPSPQSVPAPVALLDVVAVSD